jgi:hypothetical protein
VLQRLMDVQPIRLRAPCVSCARVCMRVRVAVSLRRHTHVLLEWCRLQRNYTRIKLHGDATVCATTLFLFLFLFVCWLHSIRASFLCWPSGLCSREIGAAATTLSPSHPSAQSLCTVTALALHHFRWGSDTSASPLAYFNLFFLRSTALW